MFLFENRILKCCFTNVSQHFTKIYLSNSNQKMLKCVVSSTTFLCLCTYVPVCKVLIYLDIVGTNMNLFLPCQCTDLTWMKDIPSAVVTHFKCSLSLFTIREGFQNLLFKSFFFFGEKTISVYMNNNSICRRELRGDII